MRFGLIADVFLEALKAVPCGAYAVSMDRTVVFWNRAAERMLGYGSGEVLGRRCCDVAAGPDHAGPGRECRMACPSLRYLEAGLVPHRTRLEMLCSSGERRWVIATPVVVAGADDGTPLLVHLLEDSAGPVAHAGLEGTQDGGGTAGAGRTGPGRSQAPETGAKESPLTGRELEILRLVALGWETQRIADDLGISRHTVRNHIRNLRQKLDAATKLEAVVKGVRLGVLNLG